LAGTVTNETAPLARAADYSTLLIKTTHGSTPVCLDVVRMTPKRNTRRKDLRQITVYEHFGWVNMWTVDQSSSSSGVAWKSSVRILSLAPKLSGLRRCILSQIIHFHYYNFWGTPVLGFAVCCALAKLGQSLVRVKI